MHFDIIAVRKRCLYSRIREIVLNTYQDGVVDVQVCFAVRFDPSLEFQSYSRGVPGEANTALIHLVNEFEGWAFGG